MNCPVSLVNFLYINYNMLIVFRVQGALYRHSDLRKILNQLSYKCFT